MHVDAFNSDRKSARRRAPAQSPSKAATANGQARTLRLVKLVTGQFIVRATSGYPLRQRAEDAARWLRGELQIQPTAKMAAEMFGISIPLLQNACEELERCRRVGVLSDAAVERIVVEIGPERVWRATDNLTQPGLSLAAAE